MPTTHSPKTRRLPIPAIISLHAEANKSDPFAGARMSLALSKHHDNPDEVAADAKRLLATRHAKIEEEHKVWRKSSTRREMMKFIQRKEAA